jgi:predicted dinucleotide-binding enzyme
MTSVTILGSGLMAKAIGTRVLAGGASLQLLDLEPRPAAALAAELGDAVTSGTIGDDLAGDIVVLAVPYAAAVPLVQQYGDALVGKVVVDISNPVDMSTFGGLVTPAGTSAAEEVAAAAPEGVRVVKAFNTTFAGPLLAGKVAGQPLDIFIAGDDEDARKAVATLARRGGMRPIEVGDLQRARALEWLGLLHITMQFTRGTQFASAIKIIS